MLNVKHMQLLKGVEMANLTSSCSLDSTFLPSCNPPEEEGIARSPSWKLYLAQRAQYQCEPSSSRPRPVGLGSGYEVVFGCALDASGHLVVFVGRRRSSRPRTPPPVASSAPSLPTHLAVRTKTETGESFAFNPPPETLDPLCRVFWQRTRSL